MLAMLAHVAEGSDDLDTQTAAVLTDPHGDPLVWAANTLTRGVDVPAEYRTRPGKVPWIEHAERNVIYMAARRGVRTAGMHLHLRWYPCAECARAIAQAGIAVVHCDPKPDQCEKYRFDEAAAMLAAAGVSVVQVGE